MMPGRPATINRWAALAGGYPAEAEAARCRARSSALTGTKAAAATPPVLAAVIGGAGYGAAFAAVALFPLAAAAFVPVSAEDRAARPGAAASTG